MSYYTHGVHFLMGWQRSLSALPEGTAIFLVSGCGERPKEPEAVFLDRSAAKIWIATRPDPIDYKVEGFTLTRNGKSEANLLRPGAPSVGAIEATIRKMNKRPPMKPLPHDREFKEKP